MSTPTSSGFPYTPIDAEHYKVWHTQLTRLVGRLERVASTTDNRSKLVESLGDVLFTGWSKGYPIPPYAYLKLVAVESPIANDSPAEGDGSVGSPVGSPKPLVTTYRYKLDNGEWVITLNVGGKTWGLAHDGVLMRAVFASFEAAESALRSAHSEQATAIRQMTLAQDAAAGELAITGKNPCGEIVLEAPKDSSLPMPESQPEIPEDDEQSQYFELPGGEWYLHFCGEHRWCIFKTDSDGDEEWTGKSWITEGEALHWLGQQFPSYKDYIYESAIATKDLNGNTVYIDMDGESEEGPLYKIFRLVNGRYRMTSTMMDERPKVVFDGPSMDACVVHLIKQYPDREAEIDLKWRGAKLELIRLDRLGRGGEVASAISEAHTLNTEGEQWCQERLRTHDKFGTGWILPIGSGDVFLWWVVYRASEKFVAEARLPMLCIESADTMEALMYKLERLFPQHKAAIWTRYGAYMASREAEEAPPVDTANGETWCKAKVAAEGKPGGFCVILPIENRKGEPDWWVVFETKTADAFGRDQFVAFSGNKPLGLSSDSVAGVVAGLREMYPEQRMVIKKLVNDLYGKLS